MIRFTLFIAVPVALAVWWGGHDAAAQKVGGIEPTRSDLRQAVEQYRDKADRLRRNRCMPARNWKSLDGMWRRQLETRLHWTIVYRWRMLNRDWGNCWQWYNTSGARCVVSREGSWTSNTGNGYYGGFQADLNFQAAYGGNWLRRFGTANYWLPKYQINMAWRGWLARGWQPWPNTARACGLL